MAQVVGVHGVGNYHERQSQEALSLSWTTSLNQGFIGRRPPVEVAVAYYAAALRPPQVQGDDDPDGLPPQVQDDIRNWIATLEARGGFRDRAMVEQGWATRPLRQTLDLIARRRSLDSSGLAWFVSRFFREVAAYLNPTTASAREEVQRIVAATIEENKPRVLVAHSLGSVVAWETLWANRPSTPIELFLTIGSPLALPGIVYDRLEPRGAPRRDRPPMVDRWVDLSDPGDLVAIPHPLSVYFDGLDAEFEGAIGAFDFHRVRGYLRHSATAALISSALATPERRGPEESD